MSMLKTRSCDYQYTYSDLIDNKLEIMKLDSEYPRLAELYKDLNSKRLDLMEVLNSNPNKGNYDICRELKKQYSNLIGFGWRSEVYTYFEKKDSYTKELKKLGKIYKDTVKAGEFYKTHKVAIRHNDAYAMLENKFWDFLIKLCYDDYELALKVFFDATPYLAEENKE